jgi:hypothetical protein
MALPLFLVANASRHLGISNFAQRGVTRPHNGGLLRHELARPSLSEISGDYVESTSKIGGPGIDDPDTHDNGNPLIHSDSKIDDPDMHDGRMAHAVQSWNNYVHMKKHPESENGKSTPEHSEGKDTDGNSKESKTEHSESQDKEGNRKESKTEYSESKDKDGNHKESKTEHSESKDLVKKSKDSIENTRSEAGSGHDDDRQKKSDRPSDHSKSEHKNTRSEGSESRDEKSPHGFVTVVAKDSQSLSERDDTREHDDSREVPQHGRQEKSHKIHDHTEHPDSSNNQRGEPHSEWSSMSRVQSDWGHDGRPESSTADDVKEVSDSKVDNDNKEDPEYGYPETVDDRKEVRDNEEDQADSEEVTRHRHWRGTTPL